MANMLEVIGALNQPVAMPGAAPGATPPPVYAPEPYQEPERSFLQRLAAGLTLAGAGLQGQGAQARSAYERAKDRRRRMHEEQQWRQYLLERQQWQDTESMRRFEAQQQAAATRAASEQARWEAEQGLRQQRLGLDVYKATQPPTQAPIATDKPIYDPATGQWTMPPPGAAGPGDPLFGSSLTGKAIAVLQNPESSEQDQAMARQILERERTIATPQGTIIQPGYQTGMYGGAPGALAAGTGPAPAPRTQFIEKPLTEGERRAEYTTGHMRSLNKKAEQLVSENIDFDPSGLANIPAAVMPGITGNILASPEYQQFRNVADEWARTLVFLRSGATARQEEVDAAIANYWPQPGDSPQTMRQKQQLRQEAMEEAEKLKKQREGQESVVDWSEL